MFTFAPFFSLIQVLMDIECWCSQDFNNFTGSLNYLRDLPLNLSRNRLTGRSREPILSSLNQIISGCCLLSTQYCEFGQTPYPTARALRNDPKEPIGTTRSQYAGPLPVRLVDITLELTIYCWNKYLCRCHFVLLFILSDWSR